MDFFFLLPRASCCLGITAVVTGVVALFGLQRCCRGCRCRDLPGAKRLLRCFGCDPFEDFSIIVVVHEALFTNSKGKVLTFVRLTAGRFQVSSDENNHGRFHQPLELFVEQGTTSITAELMDARYKKPLAAFKLDPKEVISGTEGGVSIREKEYPMKPKSKGIFNPRLKLTIRRDCLGDEEEGLLAHMHFISQEKSILVREHFAKVRESENAFAKSDQPSSELNMLMKACSGPLEAYGKWGVRDPIFVAVRGPPGHRRFTLGVWPDEAAKKSKPASEEIDLVKVMSVMPDPSRDDVFVVTFVQPDRVKRRMTFVRVDRSRDVWVEMLSLLILKVREDYYSRKHKK